MSLLEDEAIVVLLSAQGHDGPPAHPLLPPAMSEPSYSFPFDPLDMPTREDPPPPPSRRRRRRLRPGDASSSSSSSSSVSTAAMVAEAAQILVAANLAARSKSREDDEDEDAAYEESTREEEVRLLPPPRPNLYRTFLALRDAETERRRRRQCTSDGGSGPGDSHARVSHTGPTAEGDPPSNDDDGSLRTWEDELALAWHVWNIRDTQQWDCRGRPQLSADWIAIQRQTDDASRGEGFELDCILAVLPLVYEDGGYWHSLPHEIKHKKELAWVLLRSDERIPSPFRKMLWMDPACPLRDDREILMASIEKALEDQSTLDIAWDPKLADDREVVLTVFEKCPSYISADRVPHLLKPYLRDGAALRAFAFAPNRAHGPFYRYGPEGTRTQFSPALFQDPEFMADLVLHLCSLEGKDPWARQRLREVFPWLKWFPTLDRARQPISSWGKALISKAWAKGLGRTLLDNVEFATRLVDGLALLPSERRRLCPITYASLSVRVRGDKRVTLAFAKVAAAAHDVFFDCVPPSLRGDDAFWDELWTVATDRDPLAIYHESFRAAPCKCLLSSKGLVLRLLEATRTHDEPYRCLQEFAKLLPNLSSEIRHDREINALWVSSWAVAPSPNLPALVAPGWIQSRDFWTDLVESLACPCAAWGLVPKDLANDEGLLFVWARRASPDGAIEWLAGAVERFPMLGLLSDRSVLLNWLPHLCSDHPSADTLWRQVPQECLDCSFWVELFRDLDPPRNLLGYVPELLRSDSEIVEAQLLCLATDDLALAACYSSLSPALRERFLPRIVQAIQRSDEDSFRHTWRNVWDQYDFYRFPEAALAVLSKGGDFSGSDYLSVAWRNDPEFLLKVASAIATRRCGVGCSITTYCPAALRRDKTFVLRLLKRTTLPPYALGHDLRCDVDIQCAVHLRESIKQIRFWCWTSDWDEVGPFTREVRSRLQSFVSLDAFMAGIESARPCGALSLLRQDHDTVLALKRRLVEYVGCPFSRDEALDLRRLSNKLTLAGY